MDLKERLVEGYISLYSWLSTDNILADVLTKEIFLLPGLENIFLKNIMDMPETSVIFIIGGLQCEQVSLHG